MTRSIAAPLLDRVALVTGAGRGIGRGIALELARLGADVALVDVATDGINAVADEITEIGSKATTFVADVSDRSQVFAAVDHAASALGGFDVMARGMYDTTGWVTSIAIDDVIDEGFEALHAGTKMKVLVDPK